MKKILPIFIFLICTTSGVAYLLGINKSTNPSVASTFEPQETSPDKNTQKSLFEILDLNDLARRDDQLGTYFSQKMKADPLATLSSIDQITSNYDRQLAYKFAMVAWQIINASKFQQWLSNQPSNSNLDLGLVSLAELGTPGISSAEYANKILDTKLRESTLSAVFASWVLIEPSEAISWTLSLEQDSNKMLAIAFESLMRANPSNAIIALQTLQGFDGEKIMLAIDTVVSEFSASHLTEETFTALESLLPNSIREQLVARLVESLFNNEDSDLEALGELIATLALGDVKEELHYLLAKNYASLDPESTAEFAESLSGEAREAAVTAVVRSWSETDLEATHMWLNSLEEKIDPASESMARRSASKGQIEYTEYWLDNIEEESLRANAAKDLVDTWIERDLGFGVQKLVYEKSISVQDKLSKLHQIFPDEFFRTPEDALERLDDILRKSGYY